MSEPVVFTSPSGQAASEARVSTSTSACGRSSTTSSCGSSSRGKRRKSKEKESLTVADVYDIAADIGMCSIT